MSETVALKLVKEIPAAEEAAETTAQSVNTPEEPEKFEKPEKLEKSETSEKPEKLEKPEKPTEVAAKPADESEKPEKSESQAESAGESTGASEQAASEQAAKESEISQQTKRAGETDGGFVREEPEDYMDEEPQNYADFLEEEEQKKKSFRFRKKDVEASRDKWILSRISDEDLMEYIRLEQKRSEQMQKAKEIRDKRIITTVQLAISLTAIVAVIYFLKDNPVILTNILYIVGIVAVILFWKAPYKK